MCGILAVFGLSSAEDKRPSVLALTKLLRHRGPDWNGIHCARNYILAHERLAIVGLNSGAQPISNAEESVWLSVNGEIYNYQNLEESFEKKKFTTGSDCEVIPNEPFQFTQLNDWSFLLVHLCYVGITLSLST